MRINPENLNEDKVIKRVGNDKKVIPACKSYQPKQPKKPRVVKVKAEK